MLEKDKRKKKLEEDTQVLAELLIEVIEKEIQRLAETGEPPIWIQPRLIDDNDVVPGSKS